MSDLFDAQTKDQIESRMVQNLHTHDRYGTRRLSRVRLPEI